MFGVNLISFFVICLRASFVVFDTFAECRLICGNASYNFTPACLCCDDDGPGHDLLLERLIVFGGRTALAVSSCAGAVNPRNITFWL